VDARGGTEGVVAYHRVVRRDRRSGGFGHFLAVFLEAREVLVNEPHQAKVDEHEFHGGVSDAFAEGIRSGVDLMSAAGHGSERIGDGQAAVVVPVPVDADFLAGWLHDFFDGEFHEIVRAVGSGVADGVAKDDGTGAAANSAGIEAFHGRGVSAHGVFGDVHGRQTVVDGELDGFFGGAFEVIHGPILDEAADGTGAQKRRGLEGDAHALGDFDDGTDVVFVGARGAVGLDLHAVGGDFAGQGFRVGSSARASAGKADVQRVDAEGFHQVQDFNFFLDRGIVHGRVLQAVAEGFVIQKDARAGWDCRRRGQIPIVDPFVLWLVFLHHGISILLSGT